MNILRISENSFRLDEKAFGCASTFETNLGVQFQYNSSNRIFKTEVSASLARHETPEHPVLETSGSILLEIDEKDIEKFRVDKELVLPVEFQYRAAELTIGMIRGIVVSHMTQAGLEPVIIPIIDISDMNIKPMIIKIS